MTPLPDLPFARPAPPADVLELAHNSLMTGETPRQKFMRQRWEEAFGAVRVAIAAIREIHPSERSLLDPDERRLLGEVSYNLGKTYEALDDLSLTMLGDAMCAVLDGHITTIEQYRRETEESADG